MLKDVPLESFSLLDPEIQRCPFSFYRRLRNEAPVYWDKDTETFVVSRFSTIAEIMRNTEVFSNVGVIVASTVKSKIAGKVEEIKAQTYPSVPMLVTNDPPQHSEFRKLSNNIMSPGRIAQAQPGIEQMVDDLLGRMLVKSKGEFVAEFSALLPMMTICQMLGIPSSMWSKCREWSDALIDPLSGMISEQREIECAHLYVERQQYFADVLEAIRRDGGNPEHMLTGIALAKKQNGEVLDMTEALSLVEQILVAGGETTTHGLSMGVLMLIQQPELCNEILEDSKKLSVFVEEMLRLYSPAQGIFRRVLKDTELEGVKISAGSKIMLRLGAANRDEAAFAHADELDLHRKNARGHLAFGQGIHICQGAPLARLEMNTTFRAVATKMHNWRIDESGGGVKHIKNAVHMGLAELHIKSG